MHCKDEQRIGNLMHESTVTVKGQTTLPRIVRCRPLAELAGLLPGWSDRRVSLEEMEEAIARGASDQ